MSEVVWNKYSKEEFENVMKFSDGYIDFCQILKRKELA